MRTEHGGPSSPRHRDRDGAGRPRNARPRDAAGRPLPPGTAGVPREPEEALPPAAALARGQHLLDTGHPFAAHEVFEATWKATRDERWRGLAQLAVGLTHAQRGNATGAQRLLLRAADTLAAADPPAAAAARAAAEAVRRGERPTPPRLTGETGRPPPP